MEKEYIKQNGECPYDYVERIAKLMNLNETQRHGLHIMQGELIQVGSAFVINNLPFTIKEMQRDIDAYEDFILSLLGLLQNGDLDKKFVSIQKGTELDEAMNVIWKKCEELRKKYLFISKNKIE